MERIFLFIYLYRAFFTFLILQLFCAWLIIENNQYHGAKFFNSSNSFIAGLNSFSQSTREYFQLRDINTVLSEENAMLRKQLSQVNEKLAMRTSDQFNDPERINRFDFVSAKVVNNSTERYTNFITVNKGSQDGIQSGMAVISAAGAIGKVKMTSKHFSVVTSLLNIDLRISGILKRTGHFGTIQWDGYDPQIIELNYIPRHVKPVVGDTIITSGYSGIFPEGILIGTISEIHLSEEAPFYELKVKLAQDFRKLSFVAIIKSNLLHELDSLEQQIPDMTK